MKLRELPWLYHAAMACVLFLGGGNAAAATGKQPDLILQGEITGKDHQSYREVPFTVPAGTTRITVQFEYTGKDSKTTIDLGLLDPEGIRGWSGGNKSLFTISASDATPSYLPGPLRPGRWSLLLGVPNIRQASRSEFTARIWLGRENEPYWQPSIANPPLLEKAGWYRGDLHLHDAHSDGSCKSSAGAKVPCPLFLTVQAAMERGLDFIAITDHNTIAHANAMRELQPYFDRTLLMPGREITTFSGHANLFGTVAPLDFRVTGDRDWNAVLRDAAQLQGIVSVNHPVRPSGETCMGCGWTPQPAADPALLQAVEIVNSRDADTPYSGIPFWESLLSAGYRLTGIGGSDNHDATRTADPVGKPTTVVHAQALSMPAILAGLRAGHVFVDVRGSREQAFTFSARAGQNEAQMGDLLPSPAGTPVEFQVQAENLAGATVEVIQDGRIVKPQADLSIAQPAQTLGFTLPGDGARHWVRINLRGADGKLRLVGNPIYLNWPDHGDAGWKWEAPPPPPIPR